MRVECPACAALYDIPDHYLAGGSRKLRCARCGHDWMAEPKAEAEAEPEPEHPASPAPEEAEEEDEASFLGQIDAEERLVPPEPDAQAPAAAVKLWAAWAASLAALGGGAAAAWAWREAVMDAWPPAAHLFAALGGA